jgi:drug/metabolite transporter (DMT)-like permease
VTTLDGRNLFSGLTLAALLAVYLIWGSTYLAILYAIESMPTFTMAAGRHLLAGVLLYAWGRSRGAAPPQRQHLLPAFIIGGLLLLGGNGLVVWAEHRIPSGITALLIATEPLWIAVLLPLFRAGKSPGLRTYAGIFAGLAGVLALVAGKGIGQGAVDPIGVAGVILASGAWAAGSLYTLRAKVPSSPLIASGVQMLAGGSLLAVTGGALGEWNGFALSQVTTRSWFAFFYLVFFGSIIAFTAYSYLLRNARPTVVSTYAFVNPIVAVLLGWLIAGEPLTWRVWLAGAFILTALWAILRDDKEAEQMVVDPDPSTGDAARSCAG